MGKCEEFEWDNRSTPFDPVGALAVAPCPALERLQSLAIEMPVLQADVLQLVGAWHLMGGGNKYIHRANEVLLGGAHLRPPRPLPHAPYPGSRDCLARNAFTHSIMQIC